MVSKSTTRPTRRFEVGAIVTWPVVVDAELRAGKYELRCALDPDVLASLSDDTWSVATTPPKHLVVREARTARELTTFSWKRGQQALNEGLVDEAIVNFRRARDLDPTSPGRHLNLADAYLVKGDFESAEASYTAGLDQARLKAEGPASQRLHPESRVVSRLIQGLAAVHVERGDDALARQARRQFGLGGEDEWLLGVKAQVERLRAKRVRP